MRAALWVLFPSPLVLQKLPDGSFPQSPLSALSAAASDPFFRFWVVCVFLLPEVQWEHQHRSRDLRGRGEKVQQTGR